MLRTQLGFIFMFFLFYSFGLSFIPIIFVWLMLAGWLHYWGKSHLALHTCRNIFYDVLCCTFFPTWCRGWDFKFDCVSFWTFCFYFGKYMCKGPMLGNVGLFFLTESLENIYLEA